MSLAPIRRVVTGHDADGDAVIATDGPLPTVVELAAIPGTIFHEVWSTAATPVSIDNGADPTIGTLCLPPPAHGTRIRFVDIPPDTEDFLRHGAARMKDLLGKKEYREVYLDLSSATEQKTRVFIMDLGANGLKFRREENQPFDTADVAGRSLTFDGEWGRAKLSEQEYRKVYDETEAQYSQMLQALIAALKKPS